MRVTKHPAGARSGQRELRASPCAPSGYRLRIPVKRVPSAVTQRTDSGGPSPQGAHRAPSDLWVPNSPVCRSVYNRCSLTTSRGHPMPECPPTPFGVHAGKPRLQGAGPPPWSSGVETTAGRRGTPSGHMRHHQHPAPGEPPTLQPSLTQPPHQTPEPSLRDPGPWWPVSTPMWPQPGRQGLWAPLGPRLPPWQAGG